MPSEINDSPRVPREPEAADVRAQLERILGSEVFSRSHQLRRFLAFIVEQRLAGHAQSIKESVLAHELYGKGTDFDGGADPVVRVDARRLRDKLREYYDGRSEPVMISLPKGSYVPHFEANAVSSADADRGSVLAERQDQPHLSARRRWTTAVGAVAAVAAVATAAFMWRAPRSPIGAPAELRPLTSYPGVEGPPAMSPDGSLVAFAWSGRAEAGPNDIYVKAVESEALRQLTETPASESYPAWSPDGRSIAFVRNGNGVFTMSQLGGTERQVSASGTHVAWAGDSKSVLIRDREHDTSPFGIYQVFLDTLERRRLTQAPIGAGDYRFEVSPDGRTLAFIRYEKRGIADLYVVSMDGGEPRRLSNWNEELNGLSWTPDGREIVYSVIEPAASRLWRIPATSDTLGRGSPLTNIPLAAMNPSISRSPEGQPARLAFQTITRDVDIHLMDLDGGLVNDTIRSQPFSNSTRVEGSARFSPDGSRIAFVSYRSGGPDIWVAQRDGSGLRQVTSLGAAGVLVTDWSPDGTRIAFEAAIDGNTDVYLVGADGGHLQRLTTDPTIDGTPAWSRDGKWIYFASTRGGPVPDIWRMASSGGEATRLTRDGGFQPHESSDGRYLYYIDRAPGGATNAGSVIRMPVGGGQAERVLEHVWPLLWAITDTGIAFITHEPDFDAFDVYRFSDRRVTRIGRLGFRIPAIFTHMSASRDGRWAVAAKMERFDTDLMRIDNFR
jgi:Tol biopolymer transport system component